MSSHYRCDVCGEEMSAPKRDAVDTVFISGERSGLNLAVSIVVERKDSGTSSDLCGSCFRRAVCVAVGATP